MDFLDPKKQRAHMFRLILGYLLIGVAVLIATLILLYQAYGFGLGKDGEVIQKGLVFISSRPNPANIYLDGKIYRSATNTKLQLEEGAYKAELQREGYRTWKRILTVAGGSVQHFDYPKLVPSNMTSTNVKPYVEAPGIATQSPDRRWIVVQQGSALASFDLYDVADPTKVTTALTSLVVPETILTTTRATAHSWKLVEWSTDNRHVLLQHIFTPEGAATASEYVLMDRQTPENSINLTKTLQLTPAMQLTLRDKKFDRYYVYDTELKTLGTTSQDDAGKVVPVLSNVLAYKSYAANIVLYVTDKDTVAGAQLPAGQVNTVLFDNNRLYKIREHGATPPYLIDLAEYSNDWYIAVGASGDNKVYVYKNPQRVRQAAKTSVLVPVRIMRVAAPNYLAFSSNTEFVMAENGKNFVDFDAEYDKGYTFTSKHEVDQPATHATWMDGHRIAYVSAGKLVMFDYDNTNVQELTAASPNYTPFFDRNFDYVYALAPTPGQTGMTMTVSSFLIPADR